MLNKYPGTIVIIAITLITGQYLSGLGLFSLFILFAWESL